jgi:uncharacterized repeat protein (TIGR01451 family)
MKLLPFPVSTKLIAGVAVLSGLAGLGTYGVGKSQWFSEKPAADATPVAEAPKLGATPTAVQPIPLPGGEESKDPGMAANGAFREDRSLGLKSPDKDFALPAAPRFDSAVRPSSARGDDDLQGPVRNAGAPLNEPSNTDRRSSSFQPLAQPERGAESAERRVDDALPAGAEPAKLALTDGMPAAPEKPALPEPAVTQPPTAPDNGLRAAARAAISSVEPDMTPAAPTRREEPTAPPPAPTRQLGSHPPPASLAAPQFDLPGRSVATSVPSPPTGLTGAGTPGGEQLDGLQTPSLTLEKSAPAEIQVGKEAAFQMKVRNVGRVAAHGVCVTDRVPKGTRLVSTQPQFAENSAGQLLWQLGTLQPGDEVVVTMRLLPLEEGEIGSVAQVQFQSHASVRTVCTKPQLTLQHAGPQRVLIGDPVTFEINVGNPGTGAATGVVLEENVPEGLTHASGNELEHAIGTLKPGETRRMNLTLKADKPGRIENVLVLRGDGNLIAKDTFTVEVIAPAIEVAVNGPRLRYLEREATYEVSVANPGTAPAKEVELVTYLPKGMKFVSADHKGQYESQNHAVYWSLEELPPNQTGLAKLTVLPTETGEQKLRAEGRAAMGLQHASQKAVQVDSLAELQFSVKDAADPIEVGTDTTYAITLTNTGSSASTNIRLAIGLSPQLRPLGGEGPTRVVLERGQLAIDPLARLAPGETATYKLRVHGSEAGTHRIQVQLVTEETPVPVTREELTRVYTDK